LTRTFSCTRRPLVEQALPPEVPAGLPASLLERRPDIRDAEQHLIAAKAEIWRGQSRVLSPGLAHRWRRWSLWTGNIFSSLMSSHTGIWSYGAQVTQPIFTGGALKGNVRLAESEQRQEVIAYKQAIQLAFRDVSDALIGYQKYHQGAARRIC